jgi:hypothetical protein
MSNRKRLSWKGLPGRKTGDTPVNPVPEWALSIHQPIFLGLDENGVAVHVELAYRNLLVGGEPGGGKSVLLNNIVGHAALCPDVTLVLIDGKTRRARYVARGRRSVRRQRGRAGPRRAQ